MTQSISVGIHEAKTRLSELLRRVEAGEEIEIRRGREPLARIVPIRRSQRRTFGYDIGRFSVPDDFDEPLPDTVVATFES